MSLKRIKDLLATKRKLLVYGRGGTGKTRFVGTAALCADTAPNLHLTLSGNPIAMNDQPTLPEILRIGELSDFDLIYQFLYAGQPQSHDLWRLLEMTEPYKSVTIDGTTIVQQMRIDQITGHDSARPNFGDPVVPTEPGHYRQNNDAIAHFGGLWYGLADPGMKRPIHVFMTALEREPAIDIRSKEARATQRAPSTFSQTYRPLFLGQAIGIMEGYAEIIGRMVPVQRLRVDEMQRLDMNVSVRQDYWNAMLLAPGPDYSAKDQTLKLGDYMLDPTVSEMWEKIYGVGLGQPISK